MVEVIYLTILLLLIIEIKMIHYLLKAGFVENPKRVGHCKFIHVDGRMTEVPMHGKDVQNKKIIQEAQLKKVW